MSKTEFLFCFTRLLHILKEVQNYTKLSQRPQSPLWFILPSCLSTFSLSLSPLVFVSSVFGPRPLSSPPSLPSSGTLPASSGSCYDLVALWGDTVMSPSHLKSSMDFLGPSGCSWHSLAWHTRSFQIWPLSTYLASSPDTPVSLETACAMLAE